MPGLFSCTDETCQWFYTEDLGEVLDHIRSTHRNGFVKRPSALGTPDSHGHRWYCFRCIGKLGKDHKSFDTHRAMWDHLNAAHDCCLDTIEITLLSTSARARDDL
ncbi:hypothetical protein CERZMDRAFT_121893 [Cercospora zeae-maydis SCOH1-5]|uniref:Uncharacterized protein n=1 Tax=Cercospora zeae-maydis SCOH1-5 TaxID=717836 RepID=A0A6A6FA48_9PEZI|nr:hypothetical protein CERZMDRAFT_121893 [Cercospora zeae-maydis SCOH1-5]